MTYKENVTAILECNFAGFKQEIIDAAVDCIISLSGSPKANKGECFEGMTNGEVIQALFPNISVYEHGSTYSVNNEYNFNATWWNAPYQKGGEK